MFTKISKENISSIQLPKESSLVNFSIFNELETDLLFRSFSIKHVLEGCENYKIDGTNFKIKKGEYLLANNFSGGKLHIESHEPVKGLCIDISPKIISEVAIAFKYPDTIDNQNELHQFFCSSLYPENKYQINNTHLGNALLEISTIIKSNPNHKFEFTNEFYYNLAEKLVVEQHTFFKQVRTIKSVKTQTKKAIFRKIYLGKNYMDANFITIKNIKEIADLCTMSEYQFFRIFKLIFKVSPYQYLNEKKLCLAQQLLQNPTISISDIALQSGFIDLPTFSKNFKKHIGISPQQLKKSSF